MNIEPVISLQNVSFAYEQDAVLQNVNLELFPKEFVSIVGPNGGGKTTLFKLILGLLQPNQGDIKVFGETPARASHRIGYVPQHIQYDTLFPISVQDVVLMGRMRGQKSNRPSKEDKEAANGAIHEMTLEKHTHALFSSLSGGQRQRVLIARALCSHPDILLMDEPTANIDKVVEKKLNEILQELNKRMTILLISHDLGFVSSFVDTVVCVNRTVEKHPTSAITGGLIQTMYESDVQMVRHGHHS